MATSKKDEINAAPVVEYLFRSGIVRTIIRMKPFWDALCPTTDSDDNREELAQDLEQDIYLQLLNSRPQTQENLLTMYAKDAEKDGQALRNYIYMTVRNNVYSDNSPFARRYAKHHRNKSSNDIIPSVELKLLERDSNETEWNKF